MTLLIVIIALALIFDYINGFHDAANSIATIVSTKVLTPFQAVVWAAFFNFVAYFIFKDHAVANTIGKTVHIEYITLPVILAGLIAGMVLLSMSGSPGFPPQNELFNAPAVPVMLATCAVPTLICWAIVREWYLAPFNRVKVAA